MNWRQWIKQVSTVLGNSSSQSSGSEALELMPPAQQSMLATEADVLACFRLLLGRVPDAAGLEHFNQWLRNHVEVNCPVSVARLVEEFLKCAEFQTRYQTSVAKLITYEWVELKAHGFGMYASIEDEFIGRAIVQHQMYEPPVTALLKEKLTPGMTVLDLGANIGYFSLLSAALVGAHGRVIAFEPGFKNGQCLLLSAERNKFEQVQLYPFAVWDRKTTFLYEGNGFTGTNAIVRDLPTDFGQLALSLGVSTQPAQPFVQSMVLDQVLAHDRVDLIKIDIEGSEFRALRGARQLLSRCRPLITTEFSPTALLKMSGCSGEEYLQFLISLGYTIAVFDAEDRIECGTDVGKVMAVHDHKGVEHLDLLASPLDYSLDQ